MARPRRRLLGIAVVALLLTLTPGLAWLAVQNVPKSTNEAASPPRPVATGSPEAPPDRTKPTAAVAAPVLKQSVVGNRGRSKMYHLPGCPDLKMMLPKNRVDFADAADAQEQGFKPCSHCHPPQPLGSEP